MEEVVSSVFEIIVFNDVGLLWSVLKVLLSINDWYNVFRIELLLLIVLIESYK